MPWISKNIISLLLVIFSILLLFGVHKTQISMNNTIDKYELTDTDPVKNAPPVIAFTTIVLGSFRGLLADILWFRAGKMQDEGRYFEMAQIASWITKLQPRLSEATVFLAWNMSYNISYACALQEDRWRWVQKGISLIRDEAIQYNPSNPDIYYQLAWIYKHKIGDVLDDDHLYYKYQILKRFETIWQTDYPNWNNLLNIKISKNELIKVIDKYAVIDNFTDFERKFRFTSKLPKSLVEKINDKEIVQQIDKQLRILWFEEETKMKIAKIAELSKKYGEMDWRLPETSSLYWSSMGLEKVRDFESVTATNCQRVLAHSLRVMFKNGRIILYKENNKNQMLFLPNLKLADAVKMTYKEASERFEERLFGDSFKYFKESAVVLFYTYGEYEKAKEYYQELKTEFTENKDYSLDLRKYVIHKLTTEFKDSALKEAGSTVGSFIYQGCILFVSGRRNAAIGHIKLAEHLHKQYQFRFRGIKDRMGLPSFKTMKNNIIKMCLKNFPEKTKLNLENALKNEKDR